MPDLFLPEVPSVAPSKRRSLVRDACGCLHQQMFFWGCDARHPDGNLLIRHGLTRIARCESGGEGSSRYRMDWRGGTVELHSFCAGWFPASGDGVLFIRHRERLHRCSGGEPIRPGHYDSERVGGATNDEMLLTSLPLLEWVVGYEKWIAAQTRPGYRQRSWKRQLSQMGSRPWLPPEEAVSWLIKFLADPTSTPRARDALRRPSIFRPKKNKGEWTSPSAFDQQADGTSAPPWISSSVAGKFSNVS